MYVIYNQSTGLYAAHDCKGEHDGKFTDEAGDAALFYSWEEASDFNQNFGPDWDVRDLDA